MVNGNNSIRGPMRSDCNNVWCCLKSGHKSSWTLATTTNFHCSPFALWAVSSRTESLRISFSASASAGISCACISSKKFVKSFPLPRATKRFAKSNSEQIASKSRCALVLEAPKPMACSCNCVGHPLPCQTCHKTSCGLAPFCIALRATDINVAKLRIANTALSCRPGGTSSSTPGSNRACPISVMAGRGARCGERSKERK